jgi:hypothetical protein
MNPTIELISREESLVSFSDAETLPTSPSRDSLIQWIEEGKESHSGKRVYLEWIRDVKHNRLCTSHEAFKRFRIAINK